MQFALFYGFLTVISFPLSVDFLLVENLSIDLFKEIDFTALRSRYYVILSVYSRTYCLTDLSRHNKSTESGSKFFRK